MENSIIMNLCLLTWKACFFHRLLCLWLQINNSSLEKRECPDFLQHPVTTKWESHFYPRTPCARLSYFPSATNLPSYILPYDARPELCKCHSFSQELCQLLQMEAIGRQGRWKKKKGSVPSLVPPVPVITAPEMSLCPRSKVQFQF